MVFILPVHPNYTIDVGCGKCHSCQKRRLNDYVVRMHYELERYPNSLFVTLSFTDSALKEYENNYNKAVLQFLDALRKELGKNIRHFFVLEYGNDDTYINRKGKLAKGTKRPHFHGILFNLPWIDFTLIESIWNRGNGKRRDLRKDKNVDFFRKPRGFVYLEAIRDTGKCSSYICKYLNKDYQVPGYRHRLIVSRGFGIGYLSPLQIQLHRSTLSPFMAWNGIFRPLSQYYKNKIFTQEDKDALVKMQFISYNNPPPSKFIGKREYNPEWRCIITLNTGFGNQLNFGKWYYPNYNNDLKVYAKQMQILGVSPLMLKTVQSVKPSKPYKFVKKNLRFDEFAQSYSTFQIPFNFTNPINYES